MIQIVGVKGIDSFIADDETPTPTRFIRNCEEVGLFQDLQNVNPFDEQFRRAAEAAATATGSAAASSTSATASSSTTLASSQSLRDEALHTPQVGAWCFFFNFLLLVVLPFGTRLLVNVLDETAIARHTLLLIFYKDLSTKE